MTTVGMDSMVLNSEISILRPVKLVYAKIKARNKAGGVARRRAVKETLREIATISHKAVSPLKSNASAFVLASIRLSISEPLQLSLVSASACIVVAEGVNNCLSATLNSLISCCPFSEVIQVIRLCAALKLISG